MDPQNVIAPLPELVYPDYHVYQYTDGVWKIVRFNSTAPRVGNFHRDRDQGFKNDKKLSQAISRAQRVCLEIALCNSWKWFATFTIAKNNYDRHNLSKFYEAFTEWLKYRRKVSGKAIPYLLVPEQHGDGSWHLHGLFDSDIDDFLVSFKELDAQGLRSPSGKRLPRKLLINDYFDWPDYRKRFGFCSFGQIKSPVACGFYVSKYISKSFLGDAQRVGLKLYYCSQGLNRANLIEGIYGPCPPLDGCLQNHYEHCSTGFLVVPPEVGDEPMQDILETFVSRLQPLPVLSPDDEAEVDLYYETAHQYSFW